MSHLRLPDAEPDGSMRRVRSPVHGPDGIGIRRPLIDGVEICVVGCAEPIRRIEPFLPRGDLTHSSGRAASILVHVGLGAAADAGEVALRLPGTSVRTIPGSDGCIVSAPGVSASVRQDEICVQFVREATDVSIRAVFETLWPLILAPRGLVHIHGAAVGDVSGQGWLLAGPTNVGKSTTTLALATAGWRYAADDAVYLECQQNGQIIAHGWPEPIRVTSESARAIGVDRRPASPMSKSDALLSAELRERRVSAVSIQRVLLPEFGALTVLQPITASKAHARLLLASPWVAAQPELAQIHWSTLAAVASLPAAVLKLGPELLRRPSLLSDYLLTHGVAA